MIVNSLISSVSKYFSTLSVDSLSGDSKVSLILADSNRKPVDAKFYTPKKSESLLDNFSIANAKNLASQALEKEASLTDTLELDATESVTTNISNTSTKHNSESRQVFMDSVVRNSNRMTIVAHLDVSKLSMLQKFADPSIWMYVLHTKDMGGAISEIGYYTDSLIYHISAVNIVDSGFHNTVKVQLELEEVIMYKHETTFKFGVQQTSSASATGIGGGTGAIIDKTESWLTILEDKVSERVQSTYTLIFGGGE